MEMLHDVVITELNEIVTKKWLRGNSMDVILRPNSGFSIALGGRIVYHENERDIVSEPGTLLFLPKGAHYTWDCEADGMFIVLNFQTVKDYSAGGIRTMVLDEAFAAEFLREHRNLEKWSILAGPTGHAEQMAGIYRIILLLCRSIDNHESFRALKPAIRMLVNDYANDALSNRMLAEKSHLSEAHFRKLFKEKYGMPPMQYLGNLRINHAKTLLHESDSTVGEIAAKCGFANVYSFCRSFRKHTGKTPTEFRALLQYE